jgi:hypothetical protein
LNQPIIQIIQQSSLPDESRLNVLALFSLLRMHLNCNFATFLRTLDGPARADVVAFTSAMAQTATPPAGQVVLLAAYLDAQEVGGVFTLQQYVDQLMTVIRNDDGAAFVQRVVEFKPATPTPAPASSQPAAAGGGWGQFSLPAPGPQQAVPMAIPQGQVTAVAAISAVPPANGWAVAAASASQPPKEADIPDSDPIPEWFRPGARVTYEVGDQKLLGTLKAVDGRHATLTIDAGNAYHAVSHVYLEPSTLPYSFAVEIPAYTMADLQARLAKPIPAALLQGAVLLPIVDFIRPSPVDGTTLHISLSLVVGAGAGGQAEYCFMLQDSALETLAIRTDPVLLSSWSLSFSGFEYLLSVTSAVQPADPVSTPAKTTDKAVGEDTAAAVTPKRPSRAKKPKVS